MSDRVVHASLVDHPAHEMAIEIEIVRYDRQGRWYKEIFRGGTLVDRPRYGTVHEAADAAVDLEAAGGTIHTGRPGGKQFDAKVAGAKGRMSRR